MSFIGVDERIDLGLRPRGAIAQPQAPLNQSWNNRDFWH
jgi:hypothetical protein